MKLPENFPTPEEILAIPAEFRCQSLAYSIHAGQKRRDGKPYIAHLKRVAARGKTPEQRDLGWLHDSCEDFYEVTYEFLLDYGIPHKVAWGAQEMNKNRYADYEEYIERCAKWPELLGPVKINDILDNISDKPTHKAIAKYARALITLTK
jgi:hypothetical protein